LFGIARPALARLRTGFRRKTTPYEIVLQRDRIDRDFAFSLVVLIFFVAGIALSSSWELGARLVPEVVGIAGCIFVALQLVNRTCIRSVEPAGDIRTAVGRAGSQHMDLEADFSGLASSEVRNRALRFFGWCLFVVVAATVVGLLPALALFLLGFAITEGRERWLSALLLSGVTSASWYVIFHIVLRVPWPAAWLGDVFPLLRSLPSGSLL